MMPKGTEINAMFARVAPRYDHANHWLSGGVDFYWRYRLARWVRRETPMSILDLATGSGDVAFALRNRLGESVSITGMDFCQPMLDLADQKKESRGIARNLQFVSGDAMALPLDDAQFDALTIAFGVRNFEDRQRGFREMLRVLKPGGAAFILEFSQPYRWFRPLYLAYLKYLLPWIARWICGRRDAYLYLADSIEAFPNRRAVASELRQAGFTEVSACPLTLGIVAIHCARKAVEP